MRNAQLNARLLCCGLGLIICWCGSIRANDELTILRGPDEELTVRELESLQMPCDYQLPTLYGETNRVTLRWRKDGKTLRQVELGIGSSTTSKPPLEAMVREDSRVSVTKNTGTLQISSVLASDAGQYQCQLLVEDQPTISSGRGILNVIEQLKFAPQPTSKNLELGTVGKVHCKAQGTPTPHVKWLRETQLPLPENVTDHNGTLIFRNVSNKQRGQYTCFASSSQGEINATVSINVVVAPKFTVPPEGTIEVAETEIAWLHCQASGEPKPTIQWDRDLTYLNENNTDAGRFRLLDNGTLVIANVQPEDEGRYGCTIGSSAGFKREDVLLVVKSLKSTSSSIITRIIIVIICLAFLYFVLVLGLKLWYRYRRHHGKVQLDDVVHATAGHEHAEHEPCLTEANSVKEQRSKLRESTILEQESSQVADDIV